MNPLTAEAELTEVVRLLHEVNTRLGLLLARGGGAAMSATRQKPVIIMEHVAARCGVTVKELRSARRFARVVHARHAVFYFWRELTDLTLAAAGREMGGRDHGAVLHGCRAMSDAIQTQPASTGAEMATLRTELEQLLKP